jgi:hypothetical protein
MDTIGLDLHKRESQLCIGHDDGTVEERRIVSEAARQRDDGDAFPPARRNGCGGLCTQCGGTIGPMMRRSLWPRVRAES